MALHQRLVEGDSVGQMAAPGSRGGLTSEKAAQLFEEWGPNEIPAIATPVWRMILKQFTGTMPCMLELSCLVSALAQDWPDLGVIAAMLVVNALLGFREEMKAKNALDELTNSMESSVTCLRDGKPQVLGVSKLVPGDVIHLRGGSLAPADVTWLEGDVLSIDTAALTGEPIPRKYPSDEHGTDILSGTTVKSGEAYCVVRATGVHTEIGKGQADIMADRQSASVSVFEQRVMVIVNILIALAVVDTVMIILVQGLARDGFRSDEKKTLLTALSILIAAIPIALPLVLNVTLAIGAYHMATEHHAIVTRMSALQDIASMDVLCSDKTGTLTTARMSINLDLIWPASESGFEKVLGLSAWRSLTPEQSLKEQQKSLLLMAVMSSNADKKDDAIDGAVLRAYDKAVQDWGQDFAQSKAAYEQLSLTGFNPEVKRTVATVTCGGRKIIVAKGLATKVLDTSAGGKDSGDLQWKCADCEDPGFSEMVSKKDAELSSQGYKTLAVAAGLEGQPMYFLGLLPMIDPPRFDTAITIQRLMQAGVEVKMITGDHLNIAKETARLVGLATNILPGDMTREASHTRDELIRQAGGFAQVLPRDKRECVLALQRSYNLVVGMTGDGVNDAPALSAAQCGIAVDDATDAAKNAAAMILTTEGLSAVFGAVVESRKIFARLFSYVSYRLATTIQILIYLSVLVYAFDCALDPLYVILLALLNDVTLLPIAEDRQTASAEPEHANVGALIGFTLTLGVSQSVASLIFYLCMDRGLIEGISPHDEVGYPTGVHAQNAIWLQVSIAAEFLIFSARAPGLWFFSRPSNQLIFSTMLGNVVATLFAVYAFADPLNWSEIGTIWLYNACVLFIVDAMKMVYKLISNHNGAGIIDERAIAADDRAMAKPKEEGEPVTEFVKVVERHRESVRFLAGEAERKSRRSTLSKSFIAAGNTGRPSFRRADLRATSVLMASQLTPFGDDLRKRTPAALARTTSGSVSP